MSNILYEFLLRLEELKSNDIIFNYHFNIVDNHSSKYHTFLIEFNDVDYENISYCRMLLNGFTFERNDRLNLYFESGEYYEDKSKHFDFVIAVLNLSEI